MSSAYPRLRRLETLHSCAAHPAVPGIGSLGARPAERTAGSEDAVGGIVSSFGSALPTGTPGGGTTDFRRRPDQHGSDSDGIDAPVSAR